MEIVMARQYPRFQLGQYDNTEFCSGVNRDFYGADEKNHPMATSWSPVSVIAVWLDFRQGMVMHLRRYAFAEASRGREFRWQVPPMPSASLSMRRLSSATLPALAEGSHLDVLD
jgi:hypothetical protein